MHLTLARCTSLATPAACWYRSLCDVVEAAGKGRAAPPLRGVRGCR